MLQTFHILVERTIYLASGDDFLARAFVVGLKKLGIVTVERFPFFDTGNIKCVVKGILCM
jgi:hypothetical protein